MRAGAELDSPEVVTLTKGAQVVVEEKRGRRLRISSPCVGYVIPKAHTRQASVARTPRFVRRREVTGGAVPKPTLMPSPLPSLSHLRTQLGQRVHGGSAPDPRALDEVLVAPLGAPAPMPDFVRTCGPPGLLGVLLRHGQSFPII